MWEENDWNVCPCFFPQSILSYFIYRDDNPTFEMYIFFKTKLFCFIDPFHVRENVSKLEDKTKEI